MINTTNGQLLRTFFEIVEELKQSQVLRSDRYLGDIGEFIAAKTYNITLSENKRLQTIDGEIDGSTVQIKFSNSPTKTNINVGNAKEYDSLILILSNTSLHFPFQASSNFVGYHIQQPTILEIFSKTKNDTFSCTKKLLQKLQYTEINYSDFG